MIGGNIATNAGGACCLKYGVIGDHVAMLEAVLADGSVIRAGSLPSKDVVGLDIERLLIGSEGTLAVVVKATMRLLPKPRAVAPWSPRSRAWPGPQPRSWPWRRARSCR